MSTVNLTECETYDLPAVKAALHRLMEPSGGIGAFVEPGQRVLLKPNLLLPTTPERAITTHPAVVEAMVELVREVDGEPFIIDSPGGPLHNPVGMNRLYRDTGLQEVAERTGVPLRRDATAIQVATPDGVLLKRLDLLEVWQEADVVIALPKLKTHSLTTITGATKILFGLVPGLTKPAYHAKLPDVNRFCDMLLDVVAYVRPDLFVMDGIIGLEGDGPGLQGEPRHVGALLASRDAVAMDAVVCQIMGLDPDQLPMFRAAARRDWWPMEITIRGTPVAEVSVPDYGLPSSSQATAEHEGRGWVSQMVTQSLTPRPVPKRERCTACGTCVRSCPQDAITIVDRLAVVDLKSCIRCYCCHEVCPEAAIDLELSLLGRLLRLVGMLG